MTLFDSIQHCHTHMHMHTNLCVCRYLYFFNACQIVSVFESEHYLDLCICKWAYALIFSFHTSLKITS